MYEIRQILSCSDAIKSYLQLLVFHSTVESFRHFEQCYSKQTTSRFLIMSILARFAVLFLILAMSMYAIAAPDSADSPAEPSRVMNRHRAMHLQFFPPPPPPFFGGPFGPFPPPPPFFF